MNDFNNAQEMSLPPREIERLQSLMGLPKVGELMAHGATLLMAGLMIAFRTTVPWLFVAFLIRAFGLWLWQVWYKEFTRDDRATRRRGFWGIILSLVAAGVAAAIQFGFLA